MSGNRNQIHDMILDCAGVTTTGKRLMVAPDVQKLNLIFRLDVSANTLATSDITLKLGGDPESDDPVSGAPALLAARVTANTSIPGTIVLGTNATWTFTNPVGPTLKWGVLIVSPPPVIIPVFTFGTGGGTVRVRVKAVY